MIVLKTAQSEINNLASLKKKKSKIIQSKCKEGNKGKKSMKLKAEKQTTENISETKS